MSLDDWILALHLLAAFALVASMVGFWVVVVAARTADRPSGVAGALRMSLPLVILNGVGAIGTLVFGIWLALSVDDYRIWDGWIIAAILLWMLSGATGGRAGREYGQVAEQAARLAADGDAPDQGLSAAMRNPRAAGLLAVSSVAAIVILILMVWKPGA
ncbi:MAG TPA: DUF2269 family protein [Miltoncostaea sp.]|nr:DUF2269 family protein [Miltoncostaea sp.]